MLAQYFIFIFIFCVVLFLYLHITYHLKCGNDLEVYTIEQPSKEKLEEICDLRQPVIFEFHNENMINDVNLNILDDNYSAFDINLRDLSNKDDSSELYLPFLLSEGLNIFRSDKNSKFITENNQEFLNETAVVKTYKYNDGFLRPPLVSKCSYDFMSGSVGSKTPLRYDLNYRNYYYVTSGQVKIKLIPPHSKKYLYVKKDYDNFEFSSPLNIWDIQQEYRADFSKIKVLDVTLNKGDIIYIPAYWFYTISFEKISSICTFKYRTFMNSLAIAPELVLSLLQGQNIKRDVAVKVEKKVEEKNEEEKKVKNES
tara:strand:- start:61 stop:996 length:936 start_codon:yes stop_codon:yes gene_type:complete